MPPKYPRRDNFRFVHTGKWRVFLFFPFFAPRHAEKNYFKHNLWLGLREKSINRVFCMQAVFGREAKRKMIIEFLWWFRYFFLEMSGTWMRIYCPMTVETRMNYFWDFVRALIVPQDEWVLEQSNSIRLLQFGSTRASLVAEIFEFLGTWQRSR